MLPFLSEAPQAFSEAIVGVMVFSMLTVGLTPPADLIGALIDDEELPTIGATPTSYIDTSFEGIVVNVIDGDTVSVLVAGKQERVRVLGIDAPEVETSRSDGECYAPEAAAEVSDLVAGQVVTLVTDPTQATRDVYDRLLAYVLLSDGRDLGEELLRRGYVYEYTYGAPYQNQSRYLAAEHRAREEGRGLWFSCE